MKAQRKGTNLLIEARLRAYDEAIKAGWTSDQALSIARNVTRKDANIQRKPAVEVQGPFYYEERINRRNGVQYGTKLVRVNPKRIK